MVYVEYLNENLLLHMNINFSSLEIWSPQIFKSFWFTIIDSHECFKRSHNDNAGAETWWDENGMVKNIILILESHDFFLYFIEFKKFRVIIIKVIHSKVCKKRNTRKNDLILHASTCKTLRFFFFRTKVHKLIDRWRCTYKKYVN